MASQVEDLSEQVDDEFMMLSLKDDPIGDLFFSIFSGPQQDSDLLGFRVMTERFGSFFSDGW